MSPKNTQIRLVKEGDHELVESARVPEFFWWKGASMPNLAHLHGSYVYDNLSPHNTGVQRVHNKI